MQDLIEREEAKHPHIVRCIECENYDERDGWCDWMCMSFPKDGYCSKVKKKKEKSNAD